MLYKRASTISRIIFMLTVLLARRSTTAYKPVVIVHGIMDEPNSLNMLMDRIAEVGNFQVGRFCFQQRNSYVA